MKIYVSDIGDDSVGIQELIVATLDIHESMVEVLEDEKEMDNFKKEFMALIDKYCQPEVAYDVYSDKDLEEEARWEEEYKRELLKGIQVDKEIAEYCAGDVRATKEMYKNKPNIQTPTGEAEHSEKPSVVDVLSGKVDIPSGKIVNVIGAKTGR